MVASGAAGAGDAPDMIWPVRRADFVALPIATSIVATACTAGYPPMYATDTPHTRLAVAFATELAHGRFAQAHGMLGSELRERMSAAQLARDYLQMIEYGEGPPTTIEAVTAMSTWPDKQPGDREWVYVAMMNDTFSEAVTVVIAEEEGRLVVRSIEWGRP